MSLEQAVRFIRVFEQYISKTRDKHIKFISNFKIKSFLKELMTNEEKINLYSKSYIKNIEKVIKKLKDHFNLHDNVLIQQDTPRYIGNNDSPHFNLTTLPPFNSKSTLLPKPSINVATLPQTVATLPNAPKNSPNSYNRFLENMEFQESNKDGLTKTARNKLNENLSIIKFTLNKLNKEDYDRWQLKIQEEHIELDNKPLIDAKIKQETEELIELVIQHIKTSHQKTVVDIGTGSGCIPISIKKNIPELSIQNHEIAE
jgi:hypothetical protein